MWALSLDLRSLAGYGGRHRTRTFAAPSRHPTPHPLVGGGGEFTPGHPSVWSGPPGHHPTGPGCEAQSGKTQQVIGLPDVPPRSQCRRGFTSGRGRAAVQPRRATCPPGPRRVHRSPGGTDQPSRTAGESLRALSAAARGPEIIASIPAPPSRRIRTGIDASPTRAASIRRRHRK
jgi:hypothetical protein